MSRMTPGTPTSARLLHTDPRFGQEPAGQCLACDRAHPAVRHLRVWQTTTGGRVAVLSAYEDTPGGCAAVDDTVWAAVQRLYADPDDPIVVIEHRPSVDTFTECRMGLGGVLTWHPIAPALLLLSVGTHAYPTPDAAP